MISSHSRISKIQNLLASEIDGKVILMNIKSGKYFAFDDVSSDIWSRIDSYPLFMDLCSSLVRDYEADPAVIETDVGNLLNILKENHLLSITGEE
ncbi:PqqD family protein [Undibacterium squillarum]|uniref:Coenzyme PQQ synthesis protein D (PqqD) n=1 Tax=Undibacterium squillarum TaxID=1131567 RepID=A0ABQ2XVY8_9BURK|nr:PqqD family protein [Undibacterium squillarum]GGX36147.1 hypothetical protein GCM10010946_12200 [Undibacterium squillarum]